MAGAWTIAVFVDQDAVDGPALVEMWTREGVLGREESERRVGEILLVATDASGRPVATHTVYLQHNRQLAMDMLYGRTFVAPAAERSDLAVRLTLTARDLLSERFTSGRDRRAAGIVFEVENEGLKTRFNQGVWPWVDFTFIGDNARGDHIRVHYFPGARAPVGGG